MKKTKGISLIVLVITIIVMIIIAGAIILSLSNTNVIDQAEQAKDKYNLSQLKEAVNLDRTNALLARYNTTEGVNISVKELLGLTDSDAMNVASTNTMPANMPEGKYYKLDVTKYGMQSAGTVENNTIKGAYVINDNYDIYYIVEGTTSEVDVPTGGEDSDLVEVLGKATVGIKVEKNSTIDGQAYSSTNPIIPAGFTAINTTTSNWDAATGPEVDNGLVIRDEAGNEFVWVPVTTDIDSNGYGLNTSDFREPDVIISIGKKYDAVVENLQRAECTENPEDDDEILTSDDFKVELTNMYKSMAESVNKYDGFYVGRFETSRNGVNPQSKRSTAVSGSGEEIITAYNSSTENDWYGLYALNKKYSTSSVQGSMMWGIQYNKMMNWMVGAANTTIGDNINKERTCGTAENDVIKNVYDLYGNSVEWTLEADERDNRVGRGGNYTGCISPSDRLCSYPTYTGGDLGSRLALYVM